METIGTIHYWKERYEEQCKANEELKKENQDMQTTIIRLSKMVAGLKQTLDNFERLVRNA